MSRGFDIAEWAIVFTMYTSDTRPYDAEQKGRKTIFRPYNNQ